MVLGVFMYEIAIYSLSVNLDLLSSINPGVNSTWPWTAGVAKVHSCLGVESGRCFLAVIFPILSGAAQGDSKSNRRMRAI